MALLLLLGLAEKAEEFAVGESVDLSSTLVRRGSCDDDGWDDGGCGCEGDTERGVISSSISMSERLTGMDLTCP